MTTETNAQTPRTDAECLRFSKVALNADHIGVMLISADFARTLELEAADLRVHLRVSERDLADAVKEIADLRERLAKAEAALTAQQEPVADGVVVPRDVVLFLLGEGTLDGVWFGGAATARYSYWWRKPLRDALLAAAKEPRK